MALSSIRRSMSPGCGPLIRSFSELGLLADGDSAGWGVEEIRSRVEDVLSDYADCDVYVQDDEEPEAFTLRIRTRGIGLPYPFTRAEVYEMLDDLVEIDLQIAAEELRLGTRTTDASLGRLPPSPGHGPGRGWGDAR